MSAAGLSGARAARGFARSLAVVAATLVGLLFVTFFIGRVLPIDPVLAIVGERADHEVYEAARAAMGLDRPLWVQFFLYMKDVLRGDLGVSLLTARPVAEDILRVFPATIELATAATVIGVAIGVPFGVAAAVWHGRWPDHVIRVVGLAGYSMPVFWVGLIALFLFYGVWGIAPGPGRLDIFYEDIVEPATGFILVDSLLAGEVRIFQNALAHLALPSAVLGYYSLAYISRMTRGLMLEQMEQEYMVAARVKGLSESRVIWRHAFPNIAVPLLTVIVLSYAALLEGSVLTETIFTWPGIGFYITNALLSADMGAVLGGTVVIGATFVGLNLLSDLLYKTLDPRAQ